MQRIGFIGLGNMGLPMAKNLATAGYDVTGFDLSEEACRSAKEAGIAVGASLIDAVAGCDAVITMLPNGEIVRRVYDDVIAQAKSGSCFIDCSTIDVESARALHSHAKGASLLSIDAPVSGGVGGADGGTLTFMAGGSDTAFQMAAPLFEVMGQRAVHCGPDGTGQAAKICNNMLLAISMIGVGEAINLADKIGLDRQSLFDVVSTSSGSCWSLNTYSPMPGIGPTSPADNDYKPGFAGTLMLKDLGLSQQAAESAGVATPLGAHANSLYEEFVLSGGGDKDFSAILLFLQEQAREV